MERIEQSIKTLKICWMCPPKEQKQLIPYYMCLKGLYIHKLTTRKGLSHQDAKPINYDRSSYLNPPYPKRGMSLHQWNCTRGDYKPFWLRSDYSQQYTLLPLFQWLSAKYFLTSRHFSDFPNILKKEQKSWRRLDKAPRKSYFLAWCRF